MSDLERIAERLRTICTASSLQYADLVAGDCTGATLRFRFNGDLSARDGSSTNGVVGDDRPSDFPNRRYLVASITKPVVCLLAVQLAAEGRLAINEPVRDFLEGFHHGPSRNITIRNLLTHTSGLPDMLPNNNDLRDQQATLTDFLDHTTRIAPEFAPGTDCRYSSLGILILSAILERLCDSSIHDLMFQRIFEPFGMTSSWLGLPPDQATILMPTVLPCELPKWQHPDSDWNWNSRYWRCLGAPWGGMISTANDLGKLAVAILKNGASENGKIVLAPAAICAATSNQTLHIAGLSETDRLHRPWGFGWRLNWPDHSTCFSDFLPHDTFGHWGATGTMMWIEPKSKRWCVILTNQPYEESQSAIQHMSNLIAANL